MPPITRERVIEQLRTFSMFADVAEDDLATIAGMLNHRVFPKGTFILTQNDRTSVMYLLISGRVKLSVASPEGRELAISYLEAPEHFGEMSATDGQPQAVDVIAMTETEVLALEGKDLAKAIASQPQLAITLIASLSRRVRDLIGRLEDMAFHDATHRVQRVLLNVATASFETRGVPVIEGLTHYEIATLAGTSRETASRVISNLSRDGVVGTKGRRIVVDLFSLRDLVEHPE
ncbi:MAG: Crp/Fnr family transcriptional regulator [Aeromicrobium sp.]|jgi:CRP/FNR family transcriptional regulator/CRP/FNR family cyclic AMP-dependent transcriptional regulator|nr:Crp/Fnr family transcriptional regulator [Aeromicrobium sp.]